MNIETIIESMQLIEPSYLQVLLFIVCMISIVIFARFFGKSGLYVYSCMVIIIGNIQVLKAAQIPGFAYPIPLGNVVFTTLFLASDIITELYGSKEAKKGIWLGFVSYLVFSIIMVVTIGIKPLSLTNPEYLAFYDSHMAMAKLFTPSFAILVSSLIAYFISLWFDVLAFASLKKLCGEKLLWMRTLASTLLGIIIDTIIFSIFAWMVFKILPIDFNIVLNSYMLGTLKIRCILTIFTIPVFYLVKKLVK